MASELRVVLKTFMPIFALIILILAASESASAARPAAVLGTLDLSGHDLSSEVIPLRGEWEFYWGRLLTPDELRGSNPPAPDGYISVPGAWNGFSLGGETLSGRGYATYRLVVRLGTEDAGPVPSPGGASSNTANHALYIPWTFTAYKLWINGVPAASNGKVGPGADAMEPQFLPVTVPFIPDQESLELVFQVSNFHHRNGGLWNAPLIGAFDQIARRQAMRGAIDTLLAGAILFMGIYHMAIFLWFKDRKGPLYLGVTCLLVALRTMVTSEHMLDQIVGGLPWTVELKIEYLTGYAFVVATIGFMRALFPAETPRAMELAAWIVAGLGAGITVVSSVYVASLIIPYYVLIMTIFMLSSIGILALAAYRGREGARLTIWGGTALILSLFHDFFHYNLMGADMDLLPVGLFLLLLFQSLAIGERFALGYRREIALSTENAALLSTVQAQLDEVRQSRRLIAAADEELRRNIAERLHGRVQTRLLAVWHRLGMLRDALPKEASSAAQTIEDLRRDIDEVRELEIRQVSHLLHPSIVRVGLIPAVDSLLREYQGAFRVRLHVDDQVKAWDTPAQNAIPEQVRLVAYRVLEDALGNVQAHAQARVVTVRIAADPVGQNLLLEVTDDGRGFNRTALKPSLGLNAIAARVSTLGGWWEIESQPGAGTVLTVELPLAPEASVGDRTVRDPVTRLLARDSFDSLFGATLGQSKRVGTNVGLIFVSMPSIEEAYARWKPERVDDAVRTVAETTKRRLPPSGLAFRYDDEAIVALLPEVDEDELRGLTDTLRAALSTFRDRAAVPLETKVGAAIYPADATHEHLLVERAASNAS